jgi:hypothetical protein
MRALVALPALEVPRQDPAEHHRDPDEHDPVQHDDRGQHRGEVHVAILARRDLGEDPWNE